MSGISLLEQKDRLASPARLNPQQMYPDSELLGLLNPDS